MSREHPGYRIQAAPKGLFFVLDDHAQTQAHAPRTWWLDNGFAVIDADSDPGKPFLCNQARNNAVR